MADFEPPSSPPSESASTEETLAWYKRQYEQLELELADFRQSSGELEKELEKDLDAAEQRENTLRERAENLGFEVDEWKRKCKESKAEANAAQNTLEKEVTSLRDTNRTMQLKLRDIEVVNDDFERQARTTTSSLEDMEMKYNSAIERAVMMEEEIKIGEQEREALRIEAQRLREELSDLKIEAEILADKIKKQEQRHLFSLSTDMSVPETPAFDRSPDLTASSPMISTPPDLSSLSGKAAVAASDPPSPPMSDVSAPVPKTTATLVKTPAPSMQKKPRLPSMNNSITPKPRFGASTTSRPAAGPRLSTAGPARPLQTPSRAAAPVRAPRATNNKLPPSTSLSHIRNLTAQMARLEARVQSVRSKLPAPVSTPPGISPRGSSSLMASGNVTMRSKRRTGGSMASNITESDDATPTNTKPMKSSIHGATERSLKNVPRLSTSGVSRLSFGLTPNRGPHDSGSEYSRPSSRASASSYARPASRTDGRTAMGAAEIMPPPRPISRASLGGARTPLGRPLSRASLGPSYHAQAQSISETNVADPIERPGSSLASGRTPNRRGTYSKYEIESALNPASASGIPMPSSRRQSMEPGAIQRRQSLARIGDVGDY